MAAALHLFEGFGVELEYMIVDRATLAVRPIADKVLYAVAGSYESEVDRGPLAWSNELVLHVIELKTNGPAADLSGLADLFQQDVQRISDIAAEFGGMLMPTGMHPWMNPAAETHLWPHEYSPVYEAFDRIFGCQGHGWSNLQSIHLNLPFHNDDEFGRLHAAIRLVLPILPALAASSPICDGRDSGLADARLEAYRHNARRIPSVTGRVIPERVFSRREYEGVLLASVYRDIAPFDREGILQHEWVNARGAIARFDRNTVEIRVLDMQECPWADLAVLAFIVAVLRALVAERWCSFEQQRAWDVDPLADMLLATIRDGDQAVISDEGYLAVFGLRSSGSLRAGELLSHLFEDVFLPIERGCTALQPVRLILEKGCLARRIRGALGKHESQQERAPSLTRTALESVYRTLSECLRQGRLFDEH